jgi:Uma2 family endonuclease
MSTARSSPWRAPSARKQSSPGTCSRPCTPRSQTDPAGRLSPTRRSASQANAFFYPDVAVTRDPRDAEDYAMAYPVLHREGLSESTAAYDRGEKFAPCRQLDSLEEYVLIDPGARHAACSVATGRATVVLFSAASTGPIRLASVGLTLPRDVVFAGLKEAPRTIEGGPNSGQ